MCTLDSWPGPRLTDMSAGQAPSNHVLYANRSACYAELAGKEWAHRQKVVLWAQALAQAEQCTVLGPTWGKGYLRLATAQLELLTAVHSWEERKVKDLKWKAERAESAKNQPEKSGGSSDEAEAEEVVSEAAAALSEPEQPASSPAAGGQVDEAPIDDPYWKAEEEDDDAAPLPAELGLIVQSASLSAAETTCRAGLSQDPASLPLREKLQQLRDAGHSTDVEKDRELVDSEAADVCKADGNAKFGAKRFQDAVVCYTKALTQVRTLSPPLH